VPFVSQAQEGFFEANKKHLESMGVNVEEWEKATKGKHLPYKVPKGKT
jgi:hypothetical protein